MPSLSADFRRTSQRLRLTRLWPHVRPTCARSVCLPWLTAVKTVPQLQLSSNSKDSTIVVRQLLIPWAKTSYLHLIRLTSPISGVCWHFFFLFQTPGLAGTRQDSVQKHKAGFAQTHKQQESNKLQRRRGEVYLINCLTLLGKMTTVHPRWAATSKAHLPQV